MKIKVDEDLPNKVVELLREKGHQAVSIIEQVLGSCSINELNQSVTVVTPRGIRSRS